MNNAFLAMVKETEKIIKDYSIASNSDFTEKIKQMNVSKTEETKLPESYWVACVFCDSVFNLQNDMNQCPRCKAPILQETFQNRVAHEESTNPSEE
jgi:rubrerythrin